MRTRRAVLAVLRVAATAVLCVATAAAADQPPAPASPQRRVLVIHPLRADSAISADLDTIYRDTLSRAFGPDLDYYSESLDVVRFPEARYRRSFREYLRTRYGTQPPDVVIATVGAVLELVRHDRPADLFPGVPIVFQTGEGISGGPLSTGIGSRVDLGVVLREALELQPAIRHVAVVTGAGEIDRNYGELARQQFAAFRDRLSFSYLNGLPMADLQRAVSALPSNAIIFFVAVTVDGAGQRFGNQSGLEAVAAVAPVPIYGWHESMLGSGIVGGRLFSSRSVAERTARLAVRVLQGERPEDIPVTPVDSWVLAFDARQLRRWGIAPARLPEGSAIEFEPAPLWSRYRWLAAGAAGVLIGVAFLLRVVSVERRRRRLAEANGKEHLTNLTHAQRLVTMGQLAASLTHELQQPLGAILRNSEAASLLLSSGRFSLEELHEIVEDIRKDDKRAGAIILRMKALLRRHELNQELVDLNDVVRDTIAVVTPTARRRRVDLVVELAPEPAMVAGDPVHLQQVLLNLLLNGFDAMKGTPVDLRRLEVVVTPRAGRVEVAVRDAGPGIPQDVIDRIFDPFMTTKPDGMGMGLSIARSIVESHHGRIDASNDAATGGATFRFRIPAGSTL